MMLGRLGILSDTEGLEKMCLAVGSVADGRIGDLLGGRFAGERRSLAVG